MGLLNGAEAYHIDPRFNRGVSVTLTPSVTAINRVFEKYVFKCEGAIHLRLREARFSAPLTPNFIILKPHGYVIVNVTAPDPTVAISQNSPYVITFYLYNTQTAVLSISGFAPTGTIYPIVNPSFTVIYNSSYGVSEYGWQILYNGNVTVQKGKITINGTALIEQTLYYPINGSIIVVHSGGEVKSSIYDNTIVIYAQNTTIFSVIINGG